MKRTRLVILALLPLTAGCWSVGLTEEQEKQPWVKRFAVGVGDTTMDERAQYPNTRELTAYSADFTWIKPGAWFGYEATASYGLDEHTEPGADAETELGELLFGLRKTWLLWDLTIHPYLGAGVGALYGRNKQESLGVDDTEWTPGTYFHGGVDWHFWKNLFVGVDYRFVWENFINDGDLDLDNQAVTVRLGFTF